MYYTCQVTHEQGYRRTRDAYLTAARRLISAMERWRAVAPPLEPGPRGEIPAWTPEQLSATINAATAWQALVTRRLDYESAVRDYRPDR
jgi:hypothetical protein